MALNIGELVGYLGLDAGPFEKGIGKAFDAMGSKKFQIAGAAAGVAAGTAIMSGLLASMETEKLNAKLSASLGLTKEQSATAGAAGGQLYADNYGDSMEDVTGAVESVMSSIKGMRDASSADIQDVTKDVLNLGSAFELDVGRTSQIVGQMITSGVATDAKNAVDLLSGTLSKVPKNIREDILDAVDEYAPFMSTLGIKGEEAMGILAASSEKGMFGIDKTGDALKEFTIRATDMSKASGEAYKTLGMDQGEMSAKLLAGGDSAKAAFGEIVAGLQTMDDPLEQSQAALALFGTPLEDLSVNEIPQFLGSIDPMGDKFDSLKGKAGELDETLNSGAKNGLSAFKRAGETAMSAIGEKMLPVLAPIIDKMTEWAPMLGPLVLALGAFAAIMWVVNFAMAASPLTWIVLGVVALIAAIVLLVMNWDAVVNTLTVIWGGFVNWVVEILDGFVVWWNGLWAGVGQFIADTWNGMVRWVTVGILAIWTTITTTASNILAAWNRFWGDVGTKVSQIWESIKTGVSNGIDGVVGFVRDLPGKVLGFFSNAGTLLVEAGGNIFSGFLDGLRSGFEDVKNFIGGIGQWIADNKGPKAYDLALLVPAGGWIMSGLGKGITKAIPGLKRILSGVSATIASGVSGAEVGLSTVTGAPATARPRPAASTTTNNWHLYEQSDPQATAMNVARRQHALAS